MDLMDSTKKFERKPNPDESFLRSGSAFFFFQAFKETVHPEMIFHLFITHHLVESGSGAVLFSIVAVLDVFVGGKKSTQ